MALSGTIPLKISLLTALQNLYALHNRQCVLASLMRVGHSRMLSRGHGTNVGNLVTIGVATVLLEPYRQKYQR